MIEVGILKNFDSATYKAGVQLAGSLTTYFDDLNVAKNIASAAMVVGNYVIVAIPNDNPKDACIIASWPSGNSGGGEGGATVSTANKTIYVDKAATGAADGTSWTDAFTTIQAAVDSIEDIIVHDYTIIVRKGTTPYRETVYLNSDPASHPSHSILGTLAIKGEFYLSGDYEANVGGAGEITDTGAFGSVAVGDKVLVLDYNGANNRVQNYEYCTVDDISHAPNRISTDGAKTPSTGWKYTIARTEVSGSDDGTDGGTARDFCIYAKGMDYITIQGFYFTFSDSYAVALYASKYSYVRDVILEECDMGVACRGLSYVDVDRIFAKVGARALYFANYAKVNVSQVAFDTPGQPAFMGRAGGACYVNGFYIYRAAKGIDVQGLSLIDYLSKGTISSSVTTGVYARTNSSCHYSYTTNNATTPENPAGTTEGAYIY